MPRTGSDARRARLLVTVVFAANGAVFGAWAARIPDVKAELGLSEAVLGLVLLAPATGSLLAMPLSGAVAARRGSALTTTGFLALLCLVSWPVGVARDAALLWVALFVWGLAMGGLDVAMNAQGVAVERAAGRPVLSSLHAAFSLGALAGAGVGSVCSAAEVDLVWQQLLLGGGVAASVLPFAARVLLPDAGDAEQAPLFARPTGRLLVLGLAAFAALLAEGAAGDWSAVYMRESLGTSAMLGGLAFVVFSAAMTTGRLVGDRVVLRLGRRRTVRVLASVGAVGMAVALLLDSPAAAVGGFLLLGLGLATMVPVLFASAADGAEAPGPAIAAVSTCGYLGFLAGPTLIGLVAEAASLPVALGALPLLTGLLVLAAPATVPPGRRPPAAEAAFDGPLLER